MLTTILIIILLAIAGVLILAATRPDHFRLERSISIDAAPEIIFDQIQDFRQWRNWSPWENIDPDLRRTYTGPASGAGAVYEWDSDNNKAGQGRMEIQRTEPARSVVIELTFIKPIAAVNTAEFTLQPQDGNTRVIWAMYGPAPFMSRLFGLIFNMDKMVGGDFEKGLIALKAVSEAK
ncbi:SRPBCC family protein [Asticcacaulis sp. BYS171W]|uniref:SRPBCC family protein n=1 Tax=Asticcacaulis aquaticus TaxID=2984212 RepID=A0ABT5HT28_9CAUL|nr:SRPBCC family protein [Asticcacaulis aquaticus]MDC7682626.1 SRPBCC family protein [Asticcacaulis aquaticus]